MAPQFRKIPGDLPPRPPKGIEFSPRFIEELGRHVEAEKAGGVYSKTLDLLDQKIKKRRLSNDLEALDVVERALALVATVPNGSGGCHTDYESGVRKLVAGAAHRSGSNWPKKLADEIVAVCLGEGPDGRTIGAMKLSKRAASGGRA